MDLTPPIPGNSPLETPLTPVFGDNVQDLLNAGALNVKPTGIIVVNSIDDVANSSPGITTLRDAVKQANADSKEDLIVFDRSLFSSQQTITLKLGELDITHNLDIIAPLDSLTGGDLVTVSGKGASRVFEIEKDATVNLSGLIVADGKVTNANGGGILNNGALTLDSSIVRNHSVNDTIAFSTAAGGGIYSTGTLTVTNSTISGNSVTDLIGDAKGGGIYSSNTVTVRNSNIIGNVISGGSAGVRGGGIYGATVKVSDSTISGNKGSTPRGGFGGGIFSTDTLTVNRSSVNDNSANQQSGGNSEGGGICSTNTLTVNKSTISGNTSSVGAGIYIYSNSGISTVSNSTISSNTALGNIAFPQGGGIFNNGNLRVTNSTISSNLANSLVGKGGGIFNNGTLTLVFSTITRNGAGNGGGVYQTIPSSNVPSSTSVRNTIIAANLVIGPIGIGVNPDVSGNFTSNGYNLIGNGTGSTGFNSAKGDIIGTSSSPIDPRLDVLASNGGRTQTIALLPGSPAINAGDPTVLPTDPKTDQRGKPRVRRGRPDIGAFESSLKM